MNTTTPAPTGEQREVFLRAFLHAARNTMQRGQTALSLLRLEAAGHPQMLELIAEASRGSDALGALLEAAREHLLPLAIQTLEVDVAKLVAQQWRDTGLAETDARLEVEPASLYWTLDPVVIGAALQALFRNAQQARPAGLCVYVRCRQHRRVAGRCLELQVNDNGPGLGDEQRRHALEPFWSTRPGALGMGLPLARKAVAAHDGSLSLGVGEHGGMQVTLYLPVAERAA